MTDKQLRAIEESLRESARKHFDRTWEAESEIDGAASSAAGRVLVSLADAVEAAINAGSNA